MMNGTSFILDRSRTQGQAIEDEFIGLPVFLKGMKRDASFASSLHLIIPSSEH